MRWKVVLGTIERKPNNLIPQHHQASNLLRHGMTRNRRSN